MINVQIITHDNDLVYALEKRLKVIFANETDSKELFLVDMNNAFNPWQIGKRRQGIVFAKDYAKNPDNIVIFLILEVEEYLRHDAEFADIITLPNVGFVDILDIDKLLPKYKELAEGKKNLNEATLFLEEKQLKQKFIEAMHRSINCLAADPSLSQSWVSDARYMGLSDREIIRHVKEWRPELVESLVSHTDL